MKKIILLSAFVLALASCSAPAVEETPVAAPDTTCCVKADSCKMVCDTTKVDTAKVK